jgi:hypothetical protein
MQEKVSTEEHVHITENPAWRDVVLNKLDCYCTRFNRGWCRVVAWLKGILPYFAVAAVLLNLWVLAIAPGLHAWVARHGAWVFFLNSHDGWAYVYGAGLFFVVPLFSTAWLTYGVFRLVRTIQSQRQKRAS